jgi:predicted site-specific integrase-resolvase
MRRKRQQLAEKLGIGRATLGRWMRTGKLKPASRIGNMLLFEQAAVRPTGS